MQIPSTVLVATLVALSPWATSRLTAQPQPIPPDQFATLHKLIKPQPGELRFHEIPWLLSVHDARVQAAKEGKPILIWSGAGGAPIGVC